MRKVITLFDEYQSKENAKHVLRNMRLNAEQNFWNGAPCPLGYKLVEVEKRGTKIKKTLAIDPVDTETVKLIFKLYLHGDGESGAMGVKELVKWLNGRGYRTRKGNTFGVGMLHRMLTNTVYIGEWKFNQFSVNRLFEPARLADILSALVSRRADKADAVNGRLMQLQREVTAANEKLKRLYKLVEHGTTEIDDVLKGRLNALKTERDRAMAALERAKSACGQPILIDPALLERCGHKMRDHFTSGSIPFRKAYLQSLIDVIEVDDDQIRIKGGRDVLERAVLAQRQLDSEEYQVARHSEQNYELLCY